jgi:hypothetical protein
MFCPANSTKKKIPHGARNGKSADYFRYSYEGGVFTAL